MASSTISNNSANPNNPNPNPPTSSSPVARSATPPATRRLLHELSAYAKEPNPALADLSPTDAETSLLRWRAVMVGPEGSAYERGRWLLDIRVPDNYPLAPPTVTFVTPICHPNVHFKTGEICLDLLKGSWSPAYTLSATLSAIHQMLTYPEPDSPLNVDVAVLFREGDLIGAESLIRWCCEEWRYTGGPDRDV